jgi:hypothetical protein
MLIKYRLVYHSLADLVVIDAGFGREDHDLILATAIGKNGTTSCQNLPSN